MISKVKLLNWRSHANSELVFSAGTNALLGHMGAGKTSILDAICFSLFGTCPNLQAKKLRLDEMIMKKPQEKDKAEIETHFQMNENVYSVKRVIERGKGTTYSELRENGRLMEAPSTQRVNELVEKVMKIDYNLFSKAIYSEQNGLDYFLTIAKGQRMKKIDELLMIDKFEKARGSAISLANKVAEKILSGRIVVEHMDLEKTQKSIAELHSSLQAMSDNRQVLQQQLVAVSGEKARMEKDVERLAELRQHLEILRRQESGISSAINETNRTLQNLDSLESLSSRAVEKDVNELKRLVKSFEEMLSDKNKAYLKLQEHNMKVQAELGMIENEKLSRLEKELREKTRIKSEFDGFKSQLDKDISEKLKEKQTMLEALIGELEASKVRLNDMSDAVQQLSSLEGRCPICDSRLTAAKKKLLVKQRRLKISALKSHIEGLTEKRKSNEREFSDLIDSAKRLDLMAKELEDFESLKAELESTRNIHHLLNENAHRISKELETVGTDVDDLKSKIKGATGESQKMEIVYYKLVEYEDKKSRLALLAAEREEMLKHLDDAGKQMQGTEFDSQEKLLRGMVAQEKELAAKIAGIDNLVKERDSRVKELQAIFDAATKEKERIAKLDKASIGLKVFAKALEETQLELRREFVTVVNYTISEMWSALYPYQDFTGVRLAVEEGDYILQLQERSGKFMNVEGAVSGGERSIAALALRIAFSLVLAPNVRILILDEPTANLDKNAIHMLASTLRERINDFIDQCFLITHQSEMEEAITGVGYILDRDKKSDGETRIEQIF